MRFRFQCLSFSSESINLSTSQPFSSSLLPSLNSPTTGPLDPAPRRLPRARLAPRVVPSRVGGRTGDGVRLREGRRMDPFFVLLLLPSRPPPLLALRPALGRNPAPLPPPRAAAAAPAAAPPPPRLLLVSLPCAGSCPPNGWRWRGEEESKGEEDGGGGRDPALAAGATGGKGKGTEIEEEVMIEARRSGPTPTTLRAPSTGPRPAPPPWRR